MSAATAVRAAAAALRDAEALHAKVAEKLTAAQASAPEEIDLAPLERAVEDAAASQALGLADLASVTVASKALADARAQAAAGRSERAAQAAATQGLTRRLESAQAEELAAREALQAASVAWVQADMADAESAYLKAAEAVTKALSRRQGGARVLQSQNPEVWMRDYSLPLTLPTVGDLTRARYMLANPHAPHAVGVNLADVLPAGDVDVQADLATLIDTKPTGLVATLKRAIRA